MQLEHAIVALWIISSMLACWAFSLVVRLLAERRTRVRKQLTSDRTRRSIWLALLLVLICAAGSAVAGGAAQWISSRPNIGVVGLTPLGSAGLGMLLFACFLTIWAAIGDRAHGRLRCPRCWYDMRDSIGFPCPECGRVVKNEQQLRKSRRPRWAFVTAIVLIVFGATGLGLNARYRASGMLGFVPQRALLSMWRSVPDSWVFETGIGDRKIDLTARIASGDIGDQARRALAIDLLNEMLESAPMRWDTRRLMLLQAIMEREVFSDNPDPSQPGAVWLPDDQRVERLYTASMRDLTQYLSGDPQMMGTDLGIQISDQINSRGEWAGPISRQWFLSQRFGSPRDYYAYRRGFTPEQVDAMRETLGETTEMIEAIDSDTIYRSNDYALINFIMMLELESGVLRDRVLDMLRAYESDPGAYTPYYIPLINKGMHTLPSSVQQQAMRVIERWLISDNLTLRDASLTFISLHYQIYWGGRDDNPPEIERWIELVEQHAIGDKRVKEIKDMRYARSVSQSAISTILTIDATGEYALPIIRDNFLAPDSDRSAMNEYSWARIYDESPRIGNWVETFEPYVTYPDSDMRLWIARTIPLYSQSEYESRINAMLDILEKDPDAAVRDEAFMQVENRSSH